jgi:riboflavin synthase
MFTGIIEEVGVVERLVLRTAGGRLRIRCQKVLEDMAGGASLAVNGVCLTAVEPQAGFFTADVAPETLSRTNLGGLAPGAAVNLERPLTPSGRLDGHIVQGHIDGAGEFLSARSVGDGNWWMEVRAPAELDRYLVFKGSVALDGVSLTIASMRQQVVAVAVIPHTWKQTNLHERRRGDRVNIECDILAKYVEKQLAGRARSGLTMERLEELGF